MLRHFLTIFCIAASLAGFGQTRISLLTCYEGDEVWQLEGHSALRIQNDSTDVALNWGTFDFNSPNFVYRFVKGETDYMLSAEPTSDFLWMYWRRNRKVVEQTLNLSEEEVNKALALIQKNLRPENVVYRYKYFHDNCATRPLDIIEEAVADTLRLAEPDCEETTIRAVLSRYHRNFPWYQFGIDLALGSDLDCTMALREHAFAPVQLEQMLSKATIGVSGRPLVASTQVILDGNCVVSPTPWYQTPMAAAVLVLLLVALVTFIDLCRKKLSRWLDCVFYLLLSVGGLILTFLIFVSVHEATTLNLNYLWLNPLCLVGVIFIWCKKTARLVVWWQIINFALILTYVTCVICGIQGSNAAFWPILLADIMRSLTNIYMYRRNVKS
ncbi:MAG: DUF4105 domain-containing protein [Muribaculaceae bacterium]|nr:DUF4105 domain-containing protein [Muribaculaceae bacterium]